MSPAYPVSKPAPLGALLAVSGAALLLLQLCASAAGQSDGDCLSSALVLLIALL